MLGGKPLSAPIELPEFERGDSLKLALANSIHNMSKLCFVEEEMYTHESLWRSSTALAERLSVDADDTHHLFIPALLTTLIAYEAFVNFAGFILLPELWLDEKKNFKGTGIEGKLDVITQELTHFDWRKGEPPYQNVKRLEAFRDLVVHGKVQSNHYVVEQKRDGTHFRFEHAWDNYLTIDSVASARRDVKAFCQSLLVAMRRSSEHQHLGFNAFEGPPGSGESTSNVG